MHCCLNLFTYQAYFLFGYMYIRARSIAVYMHICVTTAVSVHIVIAGTFIMPTSCH